VSGTSGLEVPFIVLLYSVVIFVVIPLSLGAASRWAADSSQGSQVVMKVPPFFHPLTILALLATLVLIFAFQAENITNRWLDVFPESPSDPNPGLFQRGSCLRLMKLLKVPYPIAAPGALIGASNFFELAVATAIALTVPEAVARPGDRCGGVGRSSGKAVVSFFLQSN